MTPEELAGIFNRAGLGWAGWVALAAAWNEALAAATGPAR